VYSQLSEKLENNFVWCRQEEKTSVLLCLIHKIVELDTCFEKPQIVIFAATRHHVEFIHLVSAVCLAVFHLLTVLSAGFASSKH
jgi:superfamily II DNA/RNA helicase